MPPAGETPRSYHTEFQTRRHSGTCPAHFPVAGIVSAGTLPSWGPRSSGDTGSNPQAASVSRWEGWPLVGLRSRGTLSGAPRPCLHVVLTQIRQHIDTPISSPKETPLPLSPEGHLSLRSIKRPASGTGLRVSRFLQIADQPGATCQSLWVLWLFPSPGGLLTAPSFYMLGASCLSLCPL